MAGQKKLTPQMEALLELERRDMQNPGTMPDNLKQQLKAYRDQGLIPRIGGGSSGATGEQMTAAGLYARSVRANSQFEAVPEEDRGPRGLIRQAFHDVAPGIENTAINSPNRQVADQAARDFITATLRKESGAAISASEFANQYKIFFPQPGDSAQEIENKKQARIQEIEALKAAAGPAAETVDIVPATPIGQEKRDKTDVGPGINAIRPDAPSDGGGGTPTITPVAPVGSPVSTDLDKKFTAVAQAAFNSGASAGQINNIAKKYGYGPYGPDLQKAIDYRDAGGKGARILAPESGVTNPTAAQRSLSRIAASPFGAATIGAANGVTMGGLDEAAGTINALATGKPVGQSIAEMNLRKNLVSQANPTAYSLGEVGGGVTSALAGGELAGATKAVGAFAPRAMLADAAYGGIYGGLENNDNRASGAVGGALASAAGGGIGRGLVGRAASVLDPNVDPNVAFLRSKGVRTTPGQSLGDLAGRTEEKIASVPVVGDLIRNGRNRALEDFNRAYVNESLSHVGAQLPEDAVGTKAMAHAQDAFNKAYADARSGMVLKADPQMVTDLQTLDKSLADGSVSPDVYNRMQKIYDTQVARRLKGGVVSGDDYKAMMSQLGKMQDTAKRSQNFELSDSLGSMMDVLDGTARRSSPPEAVAKMDAADKGYALFVRAENAAKMRGGDTGMFTPTALDSAIQKGDSSVRSKAYLRGDALGQEWADAGKSVLRDQVPDSGTPARIAAGGMLTGAAYLHPGTVLPATGLAAAYAPGIRDVLSSAIAGERPAAVRSIGQEVRQRAYLAGGLASPLSLVYGQ